MTTDPALSNLRDLVRLVEARTLSPTEIADATLRRIARFEPELHAFIRRSDTVRDEARRVERALGRRTARTRDPLPLAGAPISIKDLILTRNSPTTAGSRTFGEGVASRHDAPVVARLRRAGAVIIGKTNLHEIAMGVTTVNEHFGASHNPWDRTRIAGGSSGGSAVAVAAGMGAASIGTDTRGSIRIPASCCGITGLKPTRGLVPTADVIPLSWTLDHVGPMTRTVEDAALLLGVLAGSTQRARRWLAAVEAPVSSLRVGLSPYYFTDIDAEIERAVREAIAVIERLAGPARPVEIAALDGAQPASAVITGAEAIAYHDARLRANPEGFGPLVRQRLARGAELTAIALVEAERTRAAVGEGFARAFREVDVLVAPTVAALPHRIGEHAVQIDGREANTLDAFTRLASPQNMAGLPALSIPCGFSAAGLPIGLQLIAAHGRDDVVLALGAAYQRETDWHLRRPPLD
jgi:aspartyl-tRNA(Asn)/glutamyl-tRNA(Gln) amidotransferase subunit A